MRDRRWLRKIVWLGARAEPDHIPTSVIELQEDTVLAALDILEREPGVLLADEVGMGKTFQTLGLIGCTLHENPKARVLVVTPTPELNEQWYWFAHRFREHGFYPFPPGAIGTTTNLRELAKTCRRHQIVTIPVSVFSTPPTRAERGFLLALWAAKRSISARRTSAIRRRMQEAGVAIEPGDEFLGFGLEAFARKGLPPIAFRREEGETRGFLGMDELYAQGLSGFDSANKSRRALDRIRFHAVRALLKPFDLLVVDEAHKLKNPWTVRSQAIGHVLRGNYERAIFLTATPFQLGADELRQVFALFANARSARAGFEEDVERLYDSVKDYQRAYDRFEEAWRFVDEKQARAFADWFGQAGTRVRRTAERLEDPNVQMLAEQAQELIRIKDTQVEPAFRQWCLRSLKPGKAARRVTHLENLQPDDDAILPFVLHQRLALEARLRGGRSRKHTFDISIGSSYGAARSGRLLRGRASEPSVRGYQEVVRDVLDRADGAHPKIAYVVREVLDAVRAGEKTLIFCERNASIRALQKGIDQAWLQEQLKSWNRACPEYTFDQVFGGSAGAKRVRGIRQKIPPRFYRSDDALSVALSESFAYNLFVPPGGDTLPRQFWQASGTIIEHANAILKRCRLTASAAVRFDFGVASRCVDQAVLHWFQHTYRRSLARGEIAECIAHERYPLEGLAFLEAPQPAKLKGGTSAPLWSISRTNFDAMLAPRRPGIWFPFRHQLARFPVAVRHLVVEAVRYFLTRREVSFLAELVERAGSPKASSAELRSTIENWWTQEHCVWRDKIGELLAYLPCLTEAEQKGVLGDMLRSPRIVQNSLASSSRIARQNSFNAPFYPMVLIGNHLLQQGLDLHRQCRRVVHYDLVWSPNDLEQRIGRVERHGCLAERYPAERPEGKVHIVYPLLEKTSDPLLYRSVRIREKWMDFLLGQPPPVGEYNPSETATQPLPPAMVARLRVELGPRSRRRLRS